MDKIVDHLLVFSGNGDINDFPGNYTQYRMWQALQPKDAEKATTQRSVRKKNYHGGTERKLSFKEKRELQRLEADIEALEKSRNKLRKNCAAARCQWKTSRKEQASATTERQA